MTKEKKRIDKKREEKKRLEFKRKFKGKVFSRAPLYVVLLTLQILLIIFIVNSLGRYSGLEQALEFILKLILIIYIVNKKQNPAYKIAWLTLICLLPLFGALAYLYISLSPGVRKILKIMNERKEKLKGHLVLEDEVIESIDRDYQDQKGLINYLYERGGYPAYENTRLKYYQTGEEGLNKMYEAIMGAKKYILLEYFIIKPGYLLDRLIEILTERAEKGVKVYFMYDGTNQFASVPINFHKKMEEAGINCQPFSPLVPFLMSYQNNRDHRKITVVDGEVAFIGGINIADEYANLIERFGYWYDNVLEFRGDAIKSLIIQFFLLWEDDEKIEIEDFFRDYEEIEGEEALVLPYTDIPEDQEGIGETVYLDMIYRAKKSIYIMTPYFIVDNEILMALCTAAKKGIDLRIYMPSIPDKRIPFYVAQTFYPELQEAGCKIYQVEEGFLHSKTCLVDCEEAVVGSINFDFRSLYLHYENACWFINSSAVDELRADFLRLEEGACLIDLDYYEKLPLYQRILGRTFRLLMPLL